MQIDFVSLFDVVAGIAPRIDIPRDEVDVYVELPLKASAFEGKLARAPIHQCFQQARAAAALLDCLFNTAASLRWLDVASTGFPLQSDLAREAGRVELVRLANQEREFRVYADQRRRLPPRWRDVSAVEVSDGPLVGNPPTVPRSYEIGFDRIALLRLLKQQEISHNLGELAPDLIVDPPLQPCQESALNKPSQADAMHSRHKQQWNFRGPLADVKKMAVQEAHDSDDVHSIWLALVAIASRPDCDRPHLLIGYVPSENVIKYRDEDVTREEDSIKELKRSEFCDSLENQRRERRRRALRTRGASPPITTSPHDSP
jgi:hypothetical protein